MSADLDALFHALASAHRRQILDVLKDRPGINVNGVCQYFSISRIAVMKHLKVLEEATLVISRKAGRNRELYLNAVPIQAIYERWTTEYSALWAGTLTALKYRVESQEAASRSEDARLLPDKEIEH